jgi:hypothetical protein
MTTLRRSTQLLLAQAASAAPAAKYNPNDPADSRPAWRWYCDRRVARTMAVLARAHGGFRDPARWTGPPPAWSPNWTATQKAALATPRATLVDAEQIPDIAAFEAALRAYFDAAIQICGLPSALPFPQPDEDVTASATLMTERAQRNDKRRPRSWTKG